MRVPFSCLALVGSHFAFLFVCADSMFRTVLFGEWKLFYVPSCEGCQHFVMEHVFLRNVGFRRISGCGRGLPPRHDCSGVPPALPVPKEA